MFDENFSFGTRSASLDSNSASSTPEEPSRPISPCSPISAYPPPQFTVTDLAASFGRSRIRQDAQICYDACDAYANLDDAGWEVDPIPTTEFDPLSASRSRITVSARQRSPSRRTQRQSSSMLLCSTKHRKDIAALVARMVSCQDQCSVAAPDALAEAAPARSANTDDDEGYDTSEDFASARSCQSNHTTQRARLDYRRSSDLRSTGASVNKSIRLRKDKVCRRKCDE